MSRVGSLVLRFARAGRLLYSALHGTAMRYAAERRSIDESIEEPREIADGRNDILGAAGRRVSGTRGRPRMWVMSWSLLGSGKNRL